MGDVTECSNWAPPRNTCLAGAIVPFGAGPSCPFVIGIRGWGVRPLGTEVPLTAGCRYCCRILLSAVVTPGASGTLRRVCQARGGAEGPLRARLPHHTSAHWAIVAWWAGLRCISGHTVVTSRTVPALGGVGVGHIGAIRAGYRVCRALGAVMRPGTGGASDSTVIRFRCRCVACTVVTRSAEGRGLRQACVVAVEPSGTRQAFLSSPQARVVRPCACWARLRQSNAVRAIATFWACHSCHHVCRCRCCSSQNAPEACTAIACNTQQG